MLTSEKILIQQEKQKTWVTFFIYISVFINSFVFFKEPFEFYLGYLIFVLLLPKYIIRYGITGPLLFIFLILFVVGFFNILTGDNTPAQFFKVYTGLMLSYFFYNYVILDYDRNIEQLFKWYLKGCYIAAIIGLIQFVSWQIGFEWGYNLRHYGLNKWAVPPGGNFGIRVNSVFGEPTYLGAVLSAAFFVSVYNLIRKETYYLTKLQSMVIVAVYVLSFSGLGQGGILLTLVFLGVSFGAVRYAFVFIPVILYVFYFLYDNLKGFQERYDSLVQLFTTGQYTIGKTHGSSFILYNNFVVAIKNFKSNFLFGTGIGSHPIAFEKYTIAGEIKQFGFNLNSQDANSMLLRLISETGLFGVGIFVYIIFKFYVKRNIHYPTNHWLISNAILIMILLNLFRQGHYFLNGFPFFVLLYIYNSIDYNRYTGDKMTVTNAPVPPTEKAG